MSEKQYEPAVPDGPLCVGGDYLPWVVIGIAAAIVFLLGFSTGYIAGEPPARERGLIRQIEKDEGVHDIQIRSLESRVYELSHPKGK